ncbi:MAG: 3-dehydroquinate synthase II, partial [Candidatus Hodarchaeota archaeon]
MKKIILNFEFKSDDFNELVQEAFNKDILNFLVSSDTHSEVVNIERLNLYSKNLEVSPKFSIYDSKKKLEQLLNESELPENVGYYKELKTKDDELEIIKLSNTRMVDFIIVSAKDWKIIPFENLIAQMHHNETNLYAEVNSVEEAELMLKTLEIGVDGILMAPRNVNDIVDLKELISEGIHIELSKAKIINIQIIPEAERVCVDTTSILYPGEGMLIGSTAKGFVLVHAEVFETKFVSSRPFRVNSGDVSAYILVPNTDPEKVYRTNYLSELKGGEKVLVVNNKGDARIVSVGRVKIETRPMLRFELEVSSGDLKIPIS